MLGRIFNWLVVVLLLLIALLALAYVALLPPEPLALPARGVTLESVILVVPGESRSPPVDLVVEGGRISAIRPAQAGTVKGFVLPGLTDAHMHGPMLPFPGEEALYAFLQLYHGVTGVRVAAGGRGMRDAVATGVYAGPRALSCGPFVDGDPPQWPSALVVTDEASAQAAIATVVSGGYDCVKVYNELTEEASQAVYLAAAVAGLPVIGHVPWRQDATDAWIDDQQHLLGLPPVDPDVGPGHSVRAMLRMDEVDAERLQALAQSLVFASVALTPTLITLERKGSLEHYAALRDAPAARLLPAYYRDQLYHNRDGLVSSRLFTAQDHTRFRAAYVRAQQSLRVLYDAGVELHTGTDAPAEFIVPGAGLIEELRLLVQGEFSPQEVLAMSSVTTARYLFGEQAGTLQVGSPADFVVYAMDPTLELAHLDSRLAVVRDGHYFSRAVLDEQLAVYLRWYDGSAYNAVSKAIVGTMLWLLNLASD